MAILENHLVEERKAEAATKMKLIDFLVVNQSKFIGLEPRRIELPIEEDEETTPVCQILLILIK